MPRTLTAAGVVVVSLVIGVAEATAQAPQPPTICADDAAFHAFDFWVGEWHVYNNANGNVAGRNTITAQEAGCVLVEQWTAASGGTGMSMNYYDPIADQWRQLWIANAYAIDIVGGLDAAGAMVLTGEIRYFTQGRSFPFRGTWTPHADGTVRQLFEQQVPETGEWQLWFDGRYEPAP